MDDLCYMPEATLLEIKEYFGYSERPVDKKEIIEFWKSLSDEEKDYYRKGVFKINTK